MRPPGAGAVERSEAPEPGVESQRPPDDLGILIHGRVSDPEGHPLKAYMELITEERRGTEVHCSEDGVYGRAGLDAGSYVMRVYVTGFQELREPMELEAGRGVVRRDFVLQPSRFVQVRLETRDGREWLQAMDLEQRRRFRDHVAVTATPFSVAEDLPLTERSSYAVTPFSIWRYRADARRRGLEVEDRCTGLLEILAEEPLQLHVAYRHFVLASQPLAPGQSRMTFRIGVDVLEQMRGAVRLQLVDGATGEPIRDANVLVSTSSDIEASGSPDEEGRLELASPPGWVELSVRAQDYGGHGQWLDVQPGQRMDLGRIELHGPTHIAGRVVDADGEPLTDAWLEAVTLKSLEGRHWTRDMRARVGENGEFKIGFFVGRGRHLLFAHCDGYGSRNMMVDTSAGSVDGLVVQLRKGARVVVEPESASGRRYRCWLQDARGQALRNPFPSNYPPELFLAPGDYRIVATLGDRVIHTERFAVGDGPALVEMELP